MKRLSLDSELVVDRSLLKIIGQLPLLRGNLFAELFESPFHDLRAGLRVKVMNGDLVKLASKKSPFDGACQCVRKEALPRLNLEDSQCRLIPREKKVNVQRMSPRPIYQLLWRVSPLEAEGRFKNRLAKSGAGAPQQKDEDQSGTPDATCHRRTFPDVSAFRKSRSRRAFVLIEATLSMAILTIVGLVLLKLSLNVLHPRQWALQQTVTDAYMTYERAYAQRVSFESITSSTSPWPIYPDASEETIELGRLPGNRPITGTVFRSRTADPGNLPKDGGTGTTGSNPAGMKVWRLQSVVSYQIGGRQYIKSRTVVRSQ
jgi:type II secretory pathway pseudopilin PulG